MYGQPAPQGSKRFMGVTKTGKGIMREQSDKLTPWRNAVVVAGVRELERLGIEAPAFDCPLVGTFYFTFLRPKTIKVAKRPYPSVPPDSSKLLRATEDGLTDAGVIRDDALIVEHHIRKSYAGEGPGLLVAGCVILLEPAVPWEMPPGRGSLELEASAV